MTGCTARYLLAAWQISDDATIGMHLGRVYESQEKKDAAIGMYLSALATVPSDKKLSEDGNETRNRLRGLLGSDSQVDDRLALLRKKPSNLRSVTIANSERDQGIAQYSIIIDGNSAILDLSANTPDDALASLSPVLRRTPMPQSFPDSRAQKLPRLATLACVAPDQPCVFTLLPAGKATRFASNE